MSRYRRFTWTHFDMKEEKEIQELDVKYLCYEREICPETKRPHLQGYLELKNPKTLLGVLKNVFQFDKLFVSYGTDEDNKKYCSKEGNFFQKGTPGEQGKRSDLDAIYEMIKEGIDIEEIAQTYPRQYMRYHSGIDKMVRLMDKIKAKKEVKESMAHIVLRPWQEKLAEKLREPPDDKTITWYVDEVGGAGKSTFTKWAAIALKAATFGNNEVRDVAFALKGNEKVVIFDFERKMREQINYEMIESVKNGNVFSNKYESCQKIFLAPHVVVFANQRPEVSALSGYKWRQEILSESPSGNTGTYGLKATLERRREGGRPAEY